MWSLKFYCCIYSHWSIMLYIFGMLNIEIVILMLSNNLPNMTHIVFLFISVCVCFSANVPIHQDLIIQLQWPEETHWIQVLIIITKYTNLSQWWRREGYEGVSKCTAITGLSFYTILSLQVAGQHLNCGRNGDHYIRKYHSEMSVIVDWVVYGNLL